MTTLTWRLKRTADGWEGTIELPAGMLATGKGETKPDAMRRASALAQAALSNPIVAAALPPGSAAALKTVSVLARSPAARAAWRTLKSGGMRSLAKSLF